MKRAAHSHGSNASSSRKKTGAQHGDVQVHRPLTPSRLDKNKLTTRPPACIVSHVLQSEPTIRIVLVACRLSNYLRQLDQAPTLPLFDFWLSSLRRALDEDPFWGPSHWEDIEIRASSLEKGIQELIRQCCELAELVVKTGNGSLAKADTSIPYHKLSVKSPEVRPSKIAKRQLDLAQEEQSWTERIILGCWTSLRADAAKARRLGSVSRPTLLVPLRARSLTS